MFTTYLLTKIYHFIVNSFTRQDSLQNLPTHRVKAHTCAGSLKCVSHICKWWLINQSSASLNTIKEESPLLLSHSYTSTQLRHNIDIRCCRYRTLNVNIIYKITNTYIIIWAKKTAQNLTLDDNLL